MDVKDFQPRKQTANDLVRQMKFTAFNARKVGEAADILEQMIKDKGCVKILGLSGALVPAGMSSCIIDMIKSKWVDIIVSTGSNMTHDIAKSFGEKFEQIEPEKIDDLELRKKGFDRIYDVVSSTKTMEMMEKNVQKIFKEIKGGEYSTYELMNEIGKRMENKNSIIRNAAENDVKIIVPAFMDSILGIQFWMYSQDHDIKLNDAKDLDYLIKLNFDLKEQNRNTGSLILGGGVPKNFILQSVLVADKPHRYVVQITTERPEFGGLSGATLEEAKSWGKIDEKSKICCVYCDATIIFPIIISALKERF
jgi:deoxyhypusine synthase